MASEYEVARAAAEKRRRIKSAELRARHLLRQIGWNASLPEVLRGVEEVPERFEGERQLIADTAVQLQSTERDRVRRFTPEEVAEVGRTYGVPEELRPRIRERITELLAQKPDHSREMMRVKVNAEFGQDIQPENFRVSYWIPAGGTVNKRAPRKKRAEASANTTSTHTNGNSAHSTVEARRPAAKRAAPKKRTPRTSRLLFRLIELEELGNDRAALRIAVGGYEFTLQGVRS